MESDASTSPRRRSTSCYSDSGDSSCSGPFSECGSDDLSFTPTAAAGIHRILLSCTAEASEDAIASLVASLESPSLDSLRRTAMELRLLAKHNPENRVRIAAAGAVRPLVALLSHPDPLLQEHGVTALLNLSLCDENKAVIVEAGAVRPLVHALKSAASPAARENAACALLRLAQLDGSAAAAIGRAGAIPLLVSLLETGTARGKKDAATALYALCSDARENRLRAVEAGAVRPLLDLMADPESGMVDKAVAPSPSPRRLRRPPGRAERSVQESSQPPAMSGRVAPANLTSSASSSRRSSAWRASRRCRSTAWSCPQVSSRLRCSGEQDEQKGGGDGACGRFRFHLQIRFQSWWGTLARLDRETPYYRKCASFCFSFFYLHGNSL